MVLAAVAFWIFVALVYDAQVFFLSRMPGERIDLRLAIAWQTTYYLLWIPLTLLVWRVSAGWIPASSRSRDWLRIVARHLPVFAAVALSHFLCLAALSKIMGIAQMPGFWNSVVAQLRGRLHLELLIYTAAAGTGAAMVLHGRYRDREMAALNLQAELAAARLDALRRQLQPHFLFNSLHSIASLARAGDTAGVVRLIAGFSELLRHLLEHGERRIALRDELALVERYLEIQRVRFADRLHATITMQDDVAGASVPLLVVQPLVENALRHGLGPQVEPGTLTVSARRDGTWTRIDVEDTGAGLPAAWSLASTTGTGLRNLASRLGAEFGTAWSLDVVARAAGGVIATVRVPYTAA
jgi:two-component system, LytTR family, sensor kinase